MPKWQLNAQADVPDLRDRMYEPSLEMLEPSMVPEVPRDRILDQGSEGACTGFSLAAVINQLSAEAGSPDRRVSPRMLYEMAKLFDEWEGEDYEGSSIRGAIRGWKNNGVCLEGTWPYDPNRSGNLTIRRAKEARSYTVGAYYRVRADISEFHAALNETKIIAVSAHVHSGWFRPGKVIDFKRKREGGHAFAIVGYDKRGFWVQNSWGPGWGQDGLALWTYEDWAYNLMDAWVVQLALPTPQIFGVKPAAAVVTEEATEKKASVPRAEIAGHFVHIDDGKFKETGQYWSTVADVKQTAELVAADEKDKYDHLLVYAHGGLNAPADSARRIRALRDGFKRNRVYPYHVMYDTGLGEELKDIVLQKGAAAQKRVGGLADWLDRAIEAFARPLGTRLWDEMKKDARVAFEKRGAGTQSLQIFLKELSNATGKAKKIHLVGHSTGGILIGHLLDALSAEDITIDTCTLLAPACNIDLYADSYVPVLRGKTKLRLPRLEVLNLNKRLEEDDNVAKVYQKSLLFLVSNAFEHPDALQNPAALRKDKDRKPKAVPLLGMAEFQRDMEKVGVKTDFVLSNGATGGKTRSRTHGGFDNDVTTMNYVLQRVLGKKAEAPFTEDEMQY